MNTRTVIIVSGAAALVLVGGLVVAGQNRAVSGIDGAETTESAPSSTPAPVASAAAPVPGTEPVTPPGTPLPPVVSDPLPADPVSATAPGTRYSTEVLPPAAPPATGLPPSKPLPELVSLPLPATASASGRLVSGFPADVIPTAPESTVIDSSVTAENDRLQATLSATTRNSSTEVLDYFRGAFARVGLYDSQAPATAGSSALIFGRDGSSITLTVTDDADGNGCSYIVFAALSAAS